MKQKNSGIDGRSKEKAIENISKDYTDTNILLSARSCTNKFAPLLPILKKR
jgi:hypothetical protein